MEIKSLAVPFFDTRRPSLTERSDREHYRPSSPTMPAVCCRLVENPPEKQCSFYVQYLAEGAANVVFKIYPWVPSAPRKPFVFVTSLRRSTLYEPPMFQGKVLRISKGHAKTGTSIEIMEGFEKRIRPLFSNIEEQVTADDFSEHLMDYEPVLLTSDVIRELTCEIGKQSLRKENLLIPIQEQIGILLPDMTSTPGQSLTIEIKPKWLQQSPNAPRDAYRCRTCALEASRKDKDRKTTYICPLQLVAGNASIIRPYIRLRVDKEYARFGASKPSDEQMNDIIDRITAYLTTGKGHKLLQCLKRIQMQLDPKGILKRDSSNPDSEANLAIAMTLRDCSMFIKVNYSYDQNTDGIECKLGDLDAKAAAKLDDWGDKEKLLVNEGWYTRIDAGGVAEFLHEKCLISAGWKKHAPHYF